MKYTGCTQCATPKCASLSPMCNIFLRILCFAPCPQCATVRKNFNSKMTKNDSYKWLIHPYNLTHPYKWLIHTNDSYIKMTHTSLVEIFIYSFCSDVDFIKWIGPGLPLKITSEIIYFKKTDEACLDNIPRTGRTSQNPKNGRSWTISTNTITTDSPSEIKIS